MIGAKNVGITENVGGLDMTRGRPKGSGGLENKKICPSCYKHNGVWVLGQTGNYTFCAFCGHRLYPLKNVLGEEYMAKFNQMMKDTA